ncbi:MAG: hypothetical protein LBR06_06240 [Bacteroidales bacterium]|jgi:hypothetical protein|nr:hypothetical protein [Bacteroidales bacterium]
MRTTVKPVLTGIARRFYAAGICRAAISPAVCFAAGAAFCLTSCDKDDVTTPDPEPVFVIDAAVPEGASPIVGRNFQYLQSAGFTRSTENYGYSTPAPNHEANDMTSDTEEFSLEETYYNGMHNDTVVFVYHDVAFNSVCPMRATTLDDGTEITKGYVIFNSPTARSGAAAPYMEISANNGAPIPYVSVLQFTLTAIQQDGDGIALYRSDNGGDYTLVNTFVPDAAGSFYSLEINMANVKFRFTPADSEKGYMAIHDLNLYSKGVPAGSALYVEEYFRTWAINGYETPYPETINKAGTNLVPSVTVRDVADYTVTKTYYTGVPVTFTVHQGANYPQGYNHHGDTTLVYGLTTGYVALPPNATEGREILSSLTVSAVPSASLVEFWIAATGMSGEYLIYKSVNGGDYTLLDEVVMTKYAGIGRYFRYFINEKNVSLKFMVRPGFTGTPKIYGIKIWSDGKP